MDRRVLTCLGPYSYYSSSTHRTAISKMHQRVLEVEGYTVSAIPYFEWSEINTGYGGIIAVSIKQLFNTNLQGLSSLETK